MVYSLGIFIVCNNQTILNKILAKLPPKTDPQVWPGDYGDPTQWDQVSFLIRASAVWAGGSAIVCKEA
jgi:hypothetical protein